MLVLLCGNRVQAITDSSPRRASLDRVCSSVEGVHMIALLRRLFAPPCCAFFGHHYRVEVTYNDDVRKLWCPRCQQVWMMDDFLHVLLPWDPELERLARWAFLDSEAQP